MTNSMSDPCDTDHGQEHMAGLLDEDAEGHARLSGLLAMLALPPVRLSDGTHRRRIVEIEVKPDSDRWVPIDGITIEPHRIIAWWGANGTRVQYEFLRGEATPRWRMPVEKSRPALPGDRP